jgi:ATP-dependent RNA helicase RhlE
MKFSSYSFTPEILRALDACNYEQMTPVQQQAIPAAGRGKDILANAQTGTGKTAAFALPILQQIADSPKEIHSENVRALILVPTRELAAQVTENIAAYSQFMSLNIVSVYGGVKMETQTKQLKQGVDVLVATPGRLLEHLQLCNTNLSHVEHLVLDEADRMLDMGFITDIRKILECMPKNFQTMLFSATLSAQMKHLANELLSNPVIVSASKENSAATTIKHVIHPVEQRRKQELLSELIGTNNWKQVLVFVNTKEAANNIVKELKLDGIKADVCHGDKGQGARRRALTEFKEGKIRALVATDVAARGLDVQGLNYVVNFDLPFLAEDYVHRIGRTGRAGEAGNAVSFVCREEEHGLVDIEMLIGHKIERKTVKGYEVSNRDRLIADISGRSAHERRQPRRNKAVGEEKPTQKPKSTGPKKPAKAKHRKTSAKQHRNGNA